MEDILSSSRDLYVYGLITRSFYMVLLLSSFFVMFIDYSKIPLPISNNILQSGLFIHPLRKPYVQHWMMMLN